MDNENQGTEGKAPPEEKVAVAAVTEPAAEQGPTELDLLKQRARLMGINFSNNVGLETLKERVRAAQEAAEQAQGAGVNPLAAVPGAPVGEEDTLTPQMRIRRDLMAEQLKMVRVRIQNLNPHKADLPGEIFTVANEYIGTVKRFVPYGEVTDDGWHLPHIIVQELEARRFQNIRSHKDKRTGQIKVETPWAKEFAIEVLPPLTQRELDQLAAAQAAAGSVG